LLIAMLLLLLALAAQPTLPEAVRSENVTTVQGAVVWLPCRTKSAGDLLWKRQQDVLTLNQQRITDDLRYSVIRQSQNEWHLQITDVQLVDAGLYSCKLSVSGKPPTTENTVQLLVFAPPHISQHSNLSVTVFEGSNVSLFCNASGFPNPLVHWFAIASLKRLESSLQAEAYQMAQHRPLFTGYHLSLVRVTRFSAGVYKCVASNHVAPNATVSIALNVHYPPQVNSNCTSTASRSFPIKLLFFRFVLALPN
jgi:hypothetical protein